MSAVLQQADKQLDDKSVQQLSLLSTLDDAFKTRASIASLDVAATLGSQHEKIVGVIKSLESRNKVRLSEPKERSIWVLTDEGKRYAEIGTPEARLFSHVKAAGKPVPLAALSSSCESDEVNIGMKNALKLKWLSMDKETQSLMCIASQIDDDVRSLLQKIGEQGEEELLKSLGEADGVNRLNVSAL